MKIHGTAKGGALDTKDFGVAFGGGSAYPDGNCVNGTCSNVTVDTDDKPSFADGCYSFNGSSSDVEISTSLVTTACSISAWFKTNTVSGDHSIFGQTEALGINLYIHNTQLRCSQLAGGGTQLLGTTTLEVDTWYNVILTKTAESGGGGNAVTTMYLNNGLENSESDWSDGTSGAVSLISGHQTDYWDGFLADFAAWNVVISSDLRTEINANSGALISSLSDKSGITTYYPMDEIDGSTCKNIAC